MGGQAGLLGSLAVGATTICLLYIATVLAVWCIVRYQTKHLPGPKPVPLVGHIPLIKKCGGIAQLCKALAK